LAQRSESQGLAGERPIAAAGARLRPRADGRLAAETLPAVPIMAPRLQGEVSSEGALRLALWGLGDVGALRLPALEGPLTLAPNLIEGRGGVGLWAAQSAPALALRGPPPHRVRPSGEGRLRVEPRGDGWLIAAGADDAELERALALGPQTIVAEAEAHARRCDRLPAAEPLLRSLVTHGVHAALASVRRDERDQFAGLAAGLIYSNPPRTYFRDGYWTLQALLQVDPDAAAAEIEFLARGVQADGEAPSAVIVGGARAQAFEARRLAHPEMLGVHWRPGEWWSDHFDSPLFFVLALADHAAAVGASTLAEQHWPRVRAVFRRYQALRGPDGLPVKPRHDRDWADNVLREGLVGYDLGLWVGALDAIARLGASLDPPLAEAARAAAGQARAAIERMLWRDGYYLDYLRADGWAEPHLALDVLTLLRFGAAAPARAAEALEAARTRLESRRNAEQPYGDFGMLCVWPPFADRQALRAKSAFPYRYHNGGDWPWLDGLYAGERLRRGLPGWRYPLTRWWETCLERGWAGAVEHFSSPFGRGSLLQAWSSLPAAVALRFADQVLKDDPDVWPPSPSARGERVWRPISSAARR
jgi:glycogen debranching enzyme